MKILIIAGKFYPMIVGSGTATYLVATELAKRGHDVTVVVDKEYRTLLKNEKLLFKIIYISGYTLYMTGKGDFRSPTSELYLKISKLNFDIIHVFNYLPMLLFSFMRDIFKSPVIFTFWNTPYKSERTIGFYNNSILDIQLAKNIINLKKYDKMILGSLCSYKSALMLGADPKRTHFKYHGIDIDKFNKDLKNYSINELDNYFDDSIQLTDTIIALPGRITERKGIIEALYAIKEVNLYQHVKLLLTGMSDPYSKNFANIIRKTANDLQITNNILIPNKNIPRKLMPIVYKRSNIVITPSYYEGLGFTAIEALAAGRPLICTDVPGLNEVGINRKNCLMIPPRNSKKLAKTIVRLLNDDVLTQKISDNGPKSIKKFDMKKFVYFVEKTYVTFINKNN